MTRLRRYLLSVPWWLWAVAAIALVLRLAPIGYGLPYELDTDEHLFVDAAWRMIENGDLDPDWYGNPATTLFAILAALYGAYAAVGMALGAFDSVAAASAAYHADVSALFMIGRLVSALAGVGVVLATYALARELRATKGWSGLAALLVAISWPMIEFSTYVRADMLLTLFMVLLVFTMVRCVREPSRAAFLIAGVLLGLAASSKYPGVIGVVPIAAGAALLLLARRVRPAQSLRWLVLAAIASAATTIVVGPYLFLNVQGVLQSVAAEARSSEAGAMGTGILTDAIRYLLALPQALGPLGTVLGVFSLIMMLVRRRPSIAASTFWAFLLFISALALWWARWALPLVPLAAVGIAYLARDIERLVWSPGRRSAIRAANAIVAVLVVAPLVVPTAVGVWARATNDDIRLRAVEWVHEHIPPGSKVLVENYTTPLSTDRYDVYVAHQGDPVLWRELSPKSRPDGFMAQLGRGLHGASAGDIVEAIRDAGIEFVVMSEHWPTIYRGEGGAFAHAVAVYDELRGAFEVLVTIDGPGRTGYPVTVLDARTVREPDPQAQD